MQFVDVLETVQPEDHELKRMAGATPQQRLDVLRAFDLVEKAGDVIDLVLLAEVGDESGKKRRLAPLVTLQIPAAAHPYPLALAVFRPVFDAVGIGTAIRDDLVGLQKSRLIVRVHLAAPDRRSVFHNFPGQAELLDH